jgi:hypothetical protein
MARNTSKPIKSAGGIGDSKIFCAPNAEKDAARERMLDCHINGVAIRELNLEPQVFAVLDYWATDEGIEERNARPNVRPPSGVELGREPFNKALEQRKDDVRDRGMETYEARDPLKEVAERYVGKGMKPKFLSPARIKDAGGVGDYQVVKDENGDPVRVKGMVLAEMPIARAEARNRHFRERGNKMLRQIGEEYQNSGGKMAVSDQ